MDRRQFLSCACGTLAGGLLSPSRGSAAPHKPAGPLRVHPTNPRYFTDDGGRPIFLTGAHTWANLQDSGVAPVPKFDWKGYLALMQSHNHNFMRLWQWQQAAWAPWTPDKILFRPTIYLRTGPGLALDGEPKFDLTKFNPEYFSRMRARIIECRGLGIYTAVQLFQGFSYNKDFLCGDKTWAGHPYHAKNNINGIDGDKNGDNVIDLDPPEIREVQAAYMKKIVDTVNDLDNVLYEVVNEGGEKGWDWWVVDTMHKFETEKGKRHPVGLTGYGTETLEEMLASPAEWVSPSSRDDRHYLSDPPVWSGKKVSVNDTDHLWGHGGTAPWAWKSFVRGHNTLLMDAWEPIAGRACPTANWGPRPGYPRRDLNRRDDPTWEPVRRAMGYTKRYADRMDLASAVPSDELASTGYCLANPEKEYLVYLPEGDEAEVDLTRASGSLTSEWMHPTAGTITPGGAVQGGKKQSFAVPFVGPAVLYIRKA